MKTGEARTFTVFKHDGELQHTAPVSYGEFFDSLGAGEELEMTLAPPETSYTLLQLRYIHGEPVKKMCQADGYTPAQAKLIILGEFFGWTRLPNGHEVPEKASLTELNRAQMTALIDWLPQFGAEHNYNILPPEKDLLKRDPRVRHVEPADVMRREKALV